MRLDEYSNPIFDEEDILDFMYENPDKIDSIRFGDILTEDSVKVERYFEFLPKDVHGVDETLQVNYLIENSIANGTDLSSGAYFHFKDTILEKIQKIYLSKSFNLFLISVNLSLIKTPFALDDVILFPFNFGCVSIVKNSL